MKVAFILTMPNVASWDGKWSGEENIYCVFRSFDGKKEIAKASALAPKHYSYNFGDGWCASVEARIVTTQQATVLKRRSKGFCGYDWMVDSIVADGAIYGPTQPKPKPTLEPAGQVSESPNAKAQ